MYSLSNIITNLTSPQDKSSWEILVRAADIRRFQPILDKQEQQPNDGVVPLVYYHTSCRNTFTLKKTLDDIQHKNGANLNDSLGGNVQPWGNSTPSTSQVYEKVCIFCQKAQKYVKGNQRDTMLRITC